MRRGPTQQAVNESQGYVAGVEGIRRRPPLPSPIAAAALILLCTVAFLFAVRSVAPLRLPWRVEVIYGALFAVAATIPTYFLLGRFRKLLAWHGQTGGALAQERSLLHALIDNIPDYVYVKDTESRFTVANQAVATLMGAKSAAEMIGKTDFDYYPKELAATFRKDEQDIIDSGRSVIQKEESSVDSAGHEKWWLTTKVPLRDARGRVVGIMGIGRDITARKKAKWEEKRADDATEAATKAERALADERNLLRTLIDNIPDHVYLKDRESHYLLCNQAMAQRLGVPSLEEVIGRTDHDFFPKEVADDFLSDEREVLRSGQPLLEHEETRVDESGNQRWTLTAKVPLRNKAGQVIGLVGIGRDITASKHAQAEMKNAQQAAEAASRAKSEFVANMSHEIRTPLNGIIGMTALTLDTELTQEQRENLDAVKVSADALLVVVNDILDFSKIEAGKLDLEDIEFDLTEVLEESVRAMALRADLKKLELLCRINPDIPRVLKGDPARLRQVVLNLLGNAIKFTERGEVELRVEPEAIHDVNTILHFRVRDTGIGIAAENQKSIFDAFSQADGSTTRKYGGTGLGLTISRRLVTMMGGTIWTESEVGRGSTFHFTARFGLGRDRAETLAPLADRLHGVKVLVVDDNATNRKILSATLARWGMSVSTAASGDAALKLIAEARAAGEVIPLVLTDLHMPGMDGFALVERIRELQDGSKTSLMMLSSGGQRGDAARCRELGIAAYLTKPIRQDELRKAIQDVLDPRGSEADTTLITRHSIREESEPLGRLRVLLAEDNPINQRLVMRMLEKRGHFVTLAENGREAVQALARQPFDLVLMDVQMPEMDGYEATAAIRANERGGTRRQPIFALTAHAMKGVEERCIAAGMDGYLTKPIDAKELDRVLESQLELRW
ncbi:MAG TPA: response regulator [Methylomirabilota bacterium]|nr:response regulator [Methylomirabilota bacterium]